MKRTIALLSMLIIAACSGPQRTGTAATSAIGEDPVSHAELTVTGLSKEESEAFMTKLSSQGDVENIILKSYQGGTAVYEMDVEGCECDLPSKVHSIPTPGFKYEGRVTKV